MCKEDLPDTLKVPSEPYSGWSQLDGMVQDFAIVVAQASIRHDLFIKAEWDTYLFVTVKDLDGVLSV